MQIRRAAATAREALLDQAASGSAWRRTSSQFATASVSPRSAATDCRTRDLLGGRQAHDQGRPRRAAEGPEGLHDRRHPVRRLDIPAKIFGTFDLRARCQAARHAARAHGASCRRRGNARRASNDAACRKIPGYVRAVRKGDFLAVVATNEWAAISASNAIVATWSDWAGLARRVAALRIRAQLEDRPQRSIAERGRHDRGAEGAAAGRCRRPTT